MAQTTEFDVAKAQAEVNEASAKLASLNTQMVNGEIEPNAETQAEIARLSADVSSKTAELELKAQEADFDKATNTAYELAEDKGALERQYQTAQNVVADAIHKAMTGQERIRISPAVEVDEDKFEVRNPKPTYQFINGQRTLCFQGHTTAPRELAEILFAPPVTRRGSNIDPTGRQTDFTTTTGSTNSPIGVDYFNQIFHQPLWAGNLTDPAVVTAIDRPDTQDYVIPTFQTRPTTALLTEGADISETDVAFHRQTLHAYEVGSATSLTKKFELASQDASVVARMWMELQESLLDQWNEWLTTGTGSSQPHGVYTAAQEAYQTGNNKVYRGGATNSNFIGSDTTLNNVNRIQVDRSNADGDPEDKLSVLTQAYGKVSGGFRRNSKFAYQLHNEYATTMLANDARNYPPTALFPWVAFPAGQAPPGVIFSHLGRPVYENPWLAKANTGTAPKLGVVGDFSRFMVRRSPIEMFVSDHTLAESHKTYLRLTTFTDSIVYQWSPSSERVGPLVFLEGIA